ncbi:MAG: hypothetical protein ABR505_08025 [Actinomycetota bacterium]
MTKRLFGLFLSLALVGGALAALPALAQPTVPDEVQIDDPFGDANGAGGDQRACAPAPVNCVDASTVADLGKIWFSNTTDQISVHIQTELPRGAGTASGNSYEVFTNPNAEGTKCLRFGAVFPGGSTAAGGTYQDEPLAKLLDRCKGDSNFFATGVEGQIAVDPLADGTGLITLTFPRAHSPLLATGGVLEVPHGVSSLAVGGAGQGFVSRMIDNTVDGTNYALQDGDQGQPSPSPSPTAGEEQPEEPKEKKCPKKKGKKGKKKKKKCPKKGPGDVPVAACAPYTPGEQGGEAETSIVTDAATEEAPVEVTIPTDPGFGIGGTPLEATISHAFHNIQVDSANPTAGLHLVLEFDLEEDYDLYLNYPDGSEAAHVAGFNPVPPLSDGTGSGGHSEMGAEYLDGVSTPDCGGYTLDIANATGLGGDKTLKLWLGEITYTPGGVGAVQGTYLLPKGAE